MGFHTLRNFSTAYLNPIGCQRPLQYDLGHLVGFLTLHNKSAMCPGKLIGNVRISGFGNTLWRFRLCAISYKVYFSSLRCAMGRVRPPVISIATISSTAKKCAIHRSTAMVHYNTRFYECSIDSNVYQSIWVVQYIHRRPSQTKKHA